MPIKQSEHGAHLGICDGFHSGRTCNAMIVLPRNMHELDSTIAKLGWRITGDSERLFCPGCISRTIARSGPTAMIDDDWINEMTAACMKVLHRQGSYNGHELTDIVARASEMAYEFAAIARVKGWTPI